MTFEDFKKNVTSWGIARDLYIEGTTIGQITKLKEEAEEVEKAYKEADINELELEIGDCYVVLQNLCMMLTIEPEECMEKAWEKIKDRKGKMISGTFVKESDLSPKK